VTTSIQFGVNNEVISDDIASHVIPANTLPDSQKPNIGIQVRTGGLTTYNTGSDAPAQASSGTMRVQLQQPTNRVAAFGTTVEPEVLENLRKMAPEAFEAPTAKQAEAKAEADTAKAEEISREDLNRHPDDQIEAAHQHFVGETSTQNQIGLLVYAHRGEAPPADLINRIADEMHVPLHEAVDKINAISMATRAQFTVLARSMNLDADKAADWIKTNRRDSAMAVAQAHTLRRDLMAWKPLLEDYRRASGDGVKH
jgi:hypothetical protein